MSPSGVRAQQLMAQGRWPEAVEQLRRSLADDPDDAAGHALLALCLANAERGEEALREADLALAADADLPLAHFARARALLELHRSAEAESAAGACLALDPDDADCHALIGQTRLVRDDRPGALAAAEAGLALDPEHRACRLLRGQLLVLLGRGAEAAAQQADDLARDPDDDWAHANTGYAKLHAGDPRAAALHFAEALRLDPDNSFARAGLVDALKARHTIYRVFLAAMLGLTRLRPGVRWAVMVGGYLVYRIADRIGEVRPEWYPWLAPLVWAYFSFAMLTWLADPVFNLILMGDPMGRYALSAAQRRAAMVAGGLTAAAGGCAMAYACGAGAIWLLTAFQTAMVAPCWNSALIEDDRRIRRVLIPATALLSLGGAVAIGLIAADRILGANMHGWLIWAWIAILFAPGVLKRFGR